MSLSDVAAALMLAQHMCNNCDNDRCELEKAPQISSDNGGMLMCKQHTMLANFGLYNTKIVSEFTDSSSMSLSPSF